METWVFQIFWFLRKNLVLDVNRVYLYRYMIGFVNYFLTKNQFYFLLTISRSQRTKNQMEEKAEQKVSDYYLGNEQENCQTIIQPSRAVTPWKVCSHEKYVFYST